MNKVEWNPDFYRYSQLNKGFFNESGLFVGTDDIRMGELYCLQEQKVLELLTILQSVEKKSRY